jgi:putative DNA primase/helicase
MSKIDFDRINAVALSNLEGLLVSIFPAGKRDGREFVIGDIHGNPGDSLKVSLDKGVWCDFASGDKGSDPISLLAAHRDCSMGDAARELDQMLAAGGIDSTAPVQRHQSKSKSDEWTALPHAPEGCSEPDTTHYKHGKPSVTWTYKDTEGRRVGVICRFDTAGGKEVMPITWCRHEQGNEGWRWKAFAKPRPLYGAERIATTTNPVLIVEGEKTADAAQRLLPHLTCVTWSGGSKAVELADWSILDNRKVVIWPDNDEPGIRAAVTIQGFLPHARIVQPPESAKGWDLADGEQEGWTTEQVRSYLKASKTEPPEVREKKPMPPAPDVLEAHEPPPPEEIPEMADPPSPVVEEEPWPFRILGHDDGHYFYLPNASQQIVGLAANEHRHLPLLRLAPANWWEQNFPGDKGADWNSAANSLIQRSHREGIFTPRRIRGRGVWVDGEHIIFHAGDNLIINNAVIKIPEFKTSFIYEQGQRLTFEAAEPMRNAEAAKLIEVCDRLSWKEPIYARFLAGWCAIAPISGVLNWRPHIWINGPSGTGKTWIVHNILDPLVGRVALHVQSATTEAGIRQSLGSDALPVLFDEAESEDMRGRMRMQSILELARQASSETGAGIIKGSASGKAQEYQIRSCFAFASIGVAASMRADTSRISSLELRKLEGDAASTQFKGLKQLWAETVGQKGYAESFRARSLYLAKVIGHNGQVFGAAVAERLGDQRVGDQLGTLLAGAFSLTSTKQVDLEFARKWVDAQDWSCFEVKDDDKDEVRALSVLMDAHIRMESERGILTRTVSEILTEAIGGEEDYVTLDEQKLAKAVLLRHGIKADAEGICISNHHAAIKAIFRDTPWADKWHNQLARVPKAEPKAGVRMGGSIHRAVRIPIEVIRATTD